MGFKAEGNLHSALTAQHMGNVPNLISKVSAPRLMDKTRSRPSIMNILCISIRAKSDTGLPSTASRTSPIFNPASLAIDA
jgi:hypothetical protein